LAKLGDKLAESLAMDDRHPKDHKFAKRQRFDKVESVRLKFGEDAISVFQTSQLIEFYIHSMTPKSSSTPFDIYHNRTCRPTSLNSCMLG